MGTSQKIIEASIIVFTKHGYLGATTKEIALTAGVSEMTLFRKFISKQNLFNIMIKTTLGPEVLNVLEPNYDLSLLELIEKLLHTRLILISNNIGLIRMIIQESMQGRVPSELDFVSQISKELKATLDKYQNIHKRSTSVLLDALISGILLHYAIMTPNIKYHEMDDIKQKEYIDSLVSQIKL